MIELGNAVITAASQGPGLFIQRRIRWSNFFLKSFHTD